MSFISGGPIQTEKLILNENNNLSELYVTNNNLFFKDQNNTTFKINNFIEPIYIKNNNVGINTNFPSSQLHIHSDLVHLELSTINDNKCKIKLNSDNCLDISEHNKININNTQLINVKTPENDNDCANKKYVDDKLNCNSLNIINELCKIYNFDPTASTSDENILEQILLRNKFKIPLITIMFAVTSEIYPICIKNNIIKFRIPSNIFITSIKASLSRVATGCKGVEFNIIQYESQCKLLKSNFCIPAGYKTQTLTYNTIDSNFNINKLVENEELSINIYSVGEVYAGNGLKITLIGL